MFGGIIVKVGGNTSKVGGITLKTGGINQIVGGIPVKIRGIHTVQPKLVKENIYIRQNFEGFLPTFVEFYQKNNKE
ncbi:hypothetical protein QE429_001172 [Bacillus sp. SORGH_AS 510]|uniref:hypothetical protein n=1 Tax=Bacillus sp. SORGH_AS_0510 TaxID=3041771 RepID=UPI0027806B0F|nr:hypothetical protein [Bacillus sp. SORGH_AS_0510]MDQ1144345.1 hypothetical protein [Bacillus sp. SORGH_AS_0510]